MMKKTYGGEGVSCFEIRPKAEYRAISLDVREGIGVKKRERGRDILAIGDIRIPIYGASSANRRQDLMMVTGGIPIPEIWVRAEYPHGMREDRAILVKLSAIPDNTLWNTEEAAAVVADGCEAVLKIRAGGSVRLNFMDNTWENNLGEYVIKNVGGELHVLEGEA